MIPLTVTHNSEQVLTISLQISDYKKMQKKNEVKVYTEKEKSKMKKNQQKTDTHVRVAVLSLSFAC